MTRLNEFVIANAYGFPAEGTLVGDSMVAASGVDIANNRWFVIFDGTVQKPTISEMLKKSLGRTKYFTSNGDVYEISTGKKFGVESTRTNPSGGLQTVVSGSITSTHVRKNPVSVSDFRSEMRDMFVSDPRRDFKEINSPKAHSAAFRDVLFSFVSYRGESYGWLKGGKIYHRRGSLIMPKLKVNRAVEGSSAFYHTHPSKDEPSLSSADDYQFYLDLAYAFGIKHFYTVMENRIDHFQFTVKKSKEEDYLKMDEDKLLDDINAIIDGAEADISKKHKGDKGLTDEDFYSKMTRETVNRLNKRFKEFVTIKYSGHAKPGLVRENPGDAGFRHNPPIRISHIHKASQLEELRDTTNNFEHYGANEYGHSQYVYWWVDHHFSLTPLHPHGRLFKLKDLGLDDETRRSLRAYMSEELAPGYSHLDVLLLLALYHDVGKVREKETGVHHSIIASEMFQNEIGPELGLPPEITDACALLMMTDCGRRNITPDGFIAQAGDYLPVAYMLQMADMLAHHPFMFTSRASEAKAEGLIDKANVEEYKKKIARDLFANIKTFLEQRVKTNPPPSVSYIVVRGSYETPIDGDIAEEYFGEEWENPKTIKSGFYHNGQIRLRDPKSGLAFAITVKDGSFTMYVRKQFFSPDDEFGLELAKDIYTRVGRILSEFTPGIRLEDIPEPDVMVNPRHSVNLHVITVSGPSGVGKSTIARNLAAMLDADLIPTVTTRPRRPREKIGQDRVFVTEKKFREMIDAGDLVEWKKQKNGHFYGRRFSDFTKPTAVVDVSLKGMRKYREAFPHTTTIFLDPDVTPEQLAKRILRRGGMTKEEATARARIASKQIADAHNMDFDMYVKSKTGKFEEIAKQIADDIEKKNPPATNFFPGEAVVDYPWLRHADLIKQNPPIKDIIRANDQQIVDSYKTKVKLVSPLVQYKKRVMGVFEIPVVEKNHQTGDLVNKGPVRLLFYSRTGTGSEGETKEEDIAKAGAYWQQYQQDEKEGKARGRLELVAESPFFRKIVGEKHGSPFGMTFDPTMYAVMFGEASDDRFHWYDKYGRKQGGKGWFIKPSYSTNPRHPSEHTANTVPIFPSIDWEADFARRFGHRTMFYAGVAIAQMIPDPFKDPRMVPSHKLRKQFTSDGMNFDVNVFMAHHNACLEEVEWGKLQESMGLDRSYDQQYARANPKPYPLPRQWPLGLRYLSADSSVEDQYPGIHDHPLGPITLWHGSPFSQSIESIKRQGLVPANQAGQRTGAGGGGGAAFVSLTPHRWEATGYAKQAAPGQIHGVRLMIGVRGRDLDHPDYTTKGGGPLWDSSLRVASVPPQYIEVFGFLKDEESLPMPREFHDMLREQNTRLEGEDWYDQLVRGRNIGNIPASELKGPAFNNPKSRQEWFEDWAKLINMKNKELEAFLESPLGKKAGLSPSEAKAQGIHSGRVSGRAILRMRKKIGLGGPKDYIKGPVHAKAVFQKAKRKWNDNDWEWCARQVRFNKRFMGDWMGKRKGPLVRDGQPTRRLLALWVWGFDPWRYARKVEKRKTMPKCPKVPWIGMTEKRMYGVQKKEVRMNPQTDLSGNTIPEIQPHLDWPMWNAPVWVPRNLIPDDAVLVRPEIGEPYYHIRQEDLDELLTSQEYLQAQEAHRQRVAREAQERREAHQRAGQKFLDDFRSNPNHVHTGAFLIYTGKHRTWDNGRQGIEAGDIVRVGNMSVQPGDATISPDVGITVPLKPIKSFIMTRPKRFSLSWVENNFEPAPVRMEDILPDELTNPPLSAGRPQVRFEKGEMIRFLGTDNQYFKHLGVYQIIEQTGYVGNQRAFRISEFPSAVGEIFIKNKFEHVASSLEETLPDELVNPPPAFKKWAEFVYEGPEQLLGITLRIGHDVTITDVRGAEGSPSAVSYLLGRPWKSGNNTGYTPVGWVSEGFLVKNFRQKDAPPMEDGLPDHLVNPHSQERDYTTRIYFPPNSQVRAKTDYHFTNHIPVRAGDILTVESHVHVDGFGISPQIFHKEDYPHTQSLVNWQIGDKMAQGDYPWFVANHELIPPPMEDSLPDELTNPPYNLSRDFERMKEMAYDVRSKELAGGFNGREWWNQQIPKIEERYGTEPLEARWLIPLDTTGFDPSDKSQEFDDNGVKPLHFLNQIKRIPMTKPPTPERIMQVALNIGQGQVHGIIPEDYGLGDFIAFDNPPPPLVPITFTQPHSGNLRMFGETTLFPEGTLVEATGSYAIPVNLDDNNSFLGLANLMVRPGDVMEVQSHLSTEGPILRKVESVDEIDDTNRINYIIKDPRYDPVAIQVDYPWFVANHKLQPPHEEEGLPPHLVNPRTPGGKKFPTRYLKGLNALEKMIAEDEIDKGYKYDADDPKAYEFWKSDIKATARGMKIGPSKHRLKYYKRYRKNIDKDYKPSGNSPKKKFINRIVKETGIKRSIIEKIYDKGLAAWRVGHRPGVQQHQWAAGRVYAFAVGADSSTGPGKPDNKLAVEAGVRKK